MNDNSTKKGAKGYEAAAIALFLVIIFGFALAFWIVPDKASSEQENRPLEQLPRAEGIFERLLDGSLTEEINLYYSDQFPMRDTFVGIEAAFEALLLKGQNNGIIMGKDGYLIAEPTENIGFIGENLGYIEEFAAAFEEAGGRCYTAIVPMGGDVLKKYMPRAYSYEQSNAVWQDIEDMAAEGSSAYIDLRAPLCGRADSGEAVYYRTDHHFTTLGAYYAYAEIAAAMGEEPYELEFFSREILSREFYGTLWSKAGFKWIAPDTIELFRYEGDDGFVTEIPYKNKSFDGFYDFEYADTKDKYGTFLSGNNSLVRAYMKNPPSERERIIVIKDSFAHSVSPFLALHFDLDIIDLRYFEQSVYEYAEANGIKTVLFLSGADTMAESDIYKILTAGIEK